MNNQVLFETIETNQRSGFRVLSVAGVPFVLPIAGELTSVQETALQGAAQLAGMGRRKVADAIVAHVQRELGVSPDLYVAGVEAAARKVAKPQREARERRAGQARRQAAAANRTVAEPEASKEVRQALAAVDEARHLLRAARGRARALRERIAVGRKAGAMIPPAALEDANRARTASWAALGVMRERSRRASELRLAQLDAFWAAHAASETADLASARGDRVATVPVRVVTIDKGVASAPVEMPGAAPLRISSHDGLATLFESRGITAHQYGAGRAYRVAYEMAGAGLKIANLNPSGGGGSSHATLASHRSAKELQRAYVLSRLNQIELAVRGVGERELRMLRLVAGEGHTLRSLTGGGNSRSKNTAALIRALDAAVEILSRPIHRGLKKSAEG